MIFEFRKWGIIQGVVSVSHRLSNTIMMRITSLVVRPCFVLRLSCCVLCGRAIIQLRGSKLSVVCCTFHWGVDFIGFGDRHFGMVEMIVLDKFYVLRSIEHGAAGRRFRAIDPYRVYDEYLQCQK